jgi:Mg-chelatase subunit ChlD
MRRWLAPVVVVAAAALPRSGPALHAGEPSPVEIALEEWKSGRNRPLGEKIVSARKLVATRHPAALKELLLEYGKPGRNQDKFRELLAPNLAAVFAGPGSEPEFAPMLREALLARLDEPQDGWLAYWVVTHWARAGRRAAAVDFYLHADKLPFHQAATLRALADSEDDTAAALAQDVIATLPECEPHRTLLLEAAARVVEANAVPGASPATRAAVEPILARLDEKETTRRTATVLGRTLARILQSDTVYADASSWRKFMDDRSAAEKLERDGYAPSKSYFAGVLITGRNIVYVIDCSGSMDAAFTWRPKAPEKPETPPAPFTGKGADEAERRRREQQAARDAQDVFRSLSSLPWDKIKTRLEAVREALKASLRALKEDQRFAVVMFSGEARYMNATTRLIAATQANVESTCSDIDRFGPGGGTNIHRGLELAFGASRTQVEDPATGTGLDQILGGADTVVLLTDGSPTADSYDARGELYAEDANIVLAARRWNLFVDAEINCVGLADAPASLLESLAQSGLGKCRFLGK